MTDLIWSFAPWVLFVVVARFGSFGEAIGAGIVAALIVLGRAIARHHVHLLDVVSVCYFAALAATVALVRPGHLDHWAQFAQAGAHATLTLVVFTSILVGHPFTESYARQSVPRAYWHTDEFQAVNRRISLVWGLAFLVGTVSLVVAGSVDYRQALLRLVIPFGSLVLAFKYTQAQTGDDEDQGSGLVSGTATADQPTA